MGKGFNGAAITAVGTAANGSAAGLSPHHEKWLEDRGLDIELAAEKGLYSDGQNLVFPYLVNGKFYNAKHRKPQKEFTFAKAGLPLVFWNDDALSEFPVTETAIITEGEPDALAVLQAGYGCVVSVPNGTPQEPTEGEINPFDDKRCAYLWSNGGLRPELKNRSRVVLAADADAPGRVLQSELAIRIGKKRCYYVRYPEGCKDANDVLRLHGLAAVRKLIEEAQPYVGGVVPFYDAPPDPPPTYYTISWAPLKDRLVLRRPELCIVTGEPNAGKSQFIRALTRQLALEHGLRTAILAFEDTRDLMSREIGRFVRCHVPGVEPRDWGNKFIHLMLPDDDEEATLEWIEERMWIAVQRFGCQCIVIDPWGDIDEDRDARENETQWVRRSLRKLARFTKRYNVIVFVVAHPRKTEGRPLTLDDISGSKHFRNKADRGLVLTRADDEKTHVKIAQQKSRDQEKMGRLGSVNMEWDWTAATYRGAQPTYSAQHDEVGE